MLPPSSPRSVSSPLVVVVEVVVGGGVSLLLRASLPGFTLAREDGPRGGGINRW